ncbi:MAG: hypothetical protein ACI86S_001227 [Paracoccaceae bacterium]|jgi:hypothetical protein
MRLYDENRDRIAAIRNSRPYLPTRIVSARGEHLDTIAPLEVGDVLAAQKSIRVHSHNTPSWWAIRTEGAENVLL